jgi:hypothetical protein
MSSDIIDRKLGYQVVKFLQTVENDENKEKLANAMEKVSALFRVDINSKEDFLALDYYNAPLDKAFLAGVQNLKARHFHDGVALVESNPRYKAFHETITSKRSPLNFKCIKLTFISHT